jgi:hypothetical protein
MNILRLARPVLIYLATLALCRATSQPLPAEEPKPAANPPTKEQPAPAKPAAEPKWDSLFDGKTLTNWEKTDFGGQGSVLVKEGAVVLEEGQPMTGITWKGKELPKVNYELRLEAQRVEGNDFFCALTFPVKEAPCSLVLGGWGGGVIGLSSIDGFDASENETTNYTTFESGKWYKVRLRVTDKQIQAWLDDERIVSVDTEGKRLSVRIEVDQNRPLGFATYQTTGAYRKIEIRELTNDEIAAKE